MTHTSRLLLLASVCVLAVLYGGSALALPHSQDYKGDGGGLWGGGSNDDWNDHHWGDGKKAPTVKEYGWEGHEPKKDWFAWGYGKEEKWYGGKDWGNDPDCDPPLTHTPEPGTLLLLGSTLAAAGAVWRKRRGVEQPTLEPSE